MFFYEFIDYQSSADVEYYLFMSYNLSEIKSVPIESVAVALGMDVRRHTALCPFHDDHRPSLRFRVSRNTCHCFACGNGGSAIDLAMRVLGCTFADACRRIAEIGGIYIDDRSVAPSRCTCTRSGVIPSVTRRQGDGNVGSRTFIDTSFVERFSSTGSSFCMALVKSGILDDVRMRRAALRYRLGCSSTGGVVFWQIDDNLRVCDGKVMWYGEDCHRLHDRKPLSASWLLRQKGFLAVGGLTGHCLFGLHLLADRRLRSGVDIAVVESEKTAVICSELFSDSSRECLWLASGGLSCLSVDMLRPLAGHNVTLFPDTDIGGDAYRYWSRIASDATERLGCPFRVSDVLERYASPEQKQHKIDIADFVL